MSAVHGQESQEMRALRNQKRTKGRTTRPSLSPGSPAQAERGRWLNRKMTTIEKEIRRAESLLPGKPAPKGKRDPRWQAIIEIGNHVKSHPTEAWSFILKWGKSPSKDLRAAIATCLLEHLLEHHFKRYFPLVQDECSRSKRFADTFSHCWEFGQTEKMNNRRQFRALQTRIQKKNSANNRLHRVREARSGGKNHDKLLGIRVSP